MSEKQKVENFLWVDLEMTGLDVDKEVIIEVAAIVTGLDLHIKETYHAIVKQPQHYIDNMDEWNTTHHGQSGLIDQIPQGKLPEVVEQELCKIVDKHFSTDSPAILAGNTIGQDRKFIDRYFKDLSSRLHYRSLDVTAWKIIFENKFDQFYEKQDTHRALSDIEESIHELKFYIDFLDSNKL